MNYKYTIIGAGMQGTAAAYDLASQNDTDCVYIFDKNNKAAKRAKRKLDKLLSEKKIIIHDDLEKALSISDAALGAASYKLNEEFAKLAIKNKCCYNDLGGNTEVVKKELLLKGEAKFANVSVVPDCGLAPGAINILAQYGLSKTSNAKHVQMFCGGLPQNPSLPLGYKKTFAIEGLINEYKEDAITLQDGKIENIKSLSDIEEYRNRLLPNTSFECATTHGGTSTCPEYYQEQLKTYSYKTIRYPKHFQYFKTLFELKSVKSYDSYLNKKIDFPNEKDMVIISIDIYGEDILKDNCYIDLIDYQDDETGFTAMERTTAFSAAIVTQMQAKKIIKPGAHRICMIDSRYFFQEFKKRFPNTQFII